MAALAEICDLANGEMAKANRQARRTMELPAGLDGRRGDEQACRRGSLHCGAMAGRRRRRRTGIVPQCSRVRFNPVGFLQRPPRHARGEANRKPSAMSLLGILRCKLTCLPAPFIY